MTKGFGIEYNPMKRFKQFSATFGNLRFVEKAVNRLRLLLAEHHV